MIKVKGYEIWFKHYPEEWGVLGGNDAPIPYIGRTECHVSFDGELLTQGDSYCGLGDIFSKAKGRKISLARAIEGFDREFRMAVWEEYLNTTSRL